MLLCFRRNFAMGLVIVEDVGVVNPCVTAPDLVGAQHSFKNELELLFCECVNAEGLGFLCCFCWQCVDDLLAVLLADPVPPATIRLKLKTASWYHVHDCGFRYCDPHPLLLGIEVELEPIEV